MRKFVVIHRWKDRILDDAKIFSLRTEAEDWIDDQLEYNPGLDYKDSFYIHEIGFKDRNRISKAGVFPWRWKPKQHSDDTCVREHCPHCGGNA